MDVDTLLFALQHDVFENAIPQQTKSPSINHVKICGWIVEVCSNRETATMARANLGFEHTSTGKTHILSDVSLCIKALQFRTHRVAERSAFYQNQ